MHNVIPVARGYWNHVENQRHKMNELATKLSILLKSGSIVTDKQ